MLDCARDRACPESQRFLRDFREACRAHFLRECLAIEVGFHRPREVAVRAALVARKDRCGAGHDRVGIETIGSANERIAWLRELKNDDSTVRAQNAVELTERLRGISNIADAERDRNNVGARIWQLQRRRVAFGVLDLRSRWLAFVRRLHPRDFKHLRREVDPAHTSDSRREKRFREIACAARDIDDIVRCGDFCKPHRCPSPHLIEPERMHAIVEVVPFGDRRKHRLHTGWLVAEFVRIACE